jgi:thiamine-phosphate pyrophosphorylase
VTNPTFGDIKERLRLTLVVGRAEARPRTIRELAEAVFAGGVTALQLREKHLPTADLYRLAHSLAEFCREREKLFIINDRLDIALAADADGLHLGIDDLPLEVARRYWPKPKILGATVKTLDEAQRALDVGADYLGVGALFPSPTKPEVPILSLKILREIQKTRLPLVGIGGITAETVARAWSYGVDGLAAISALARAEDPTQAARLLAKKLI